MIELKDVLDSMQHAQGLNAGVYKEKKTLYDYEEGGVV